MTEIKVKQHDTKGIFIDVLKLDGVPINLTGCTVYFMMRRPGFAIKQVAAVTDQLGGAVQYQPIATDMSELGRFKQEWEVVFPDARIITAPNKDYNLVIIEPDLG